MLKMSPFTIDSLFTGRRYWLKDPITNSLSRAVNLHYVNENSSAVYNITHCKIALRTFNTRCVAKRTIVSSYN